MQGRSMPRLPVDSRRPRYRKIVSNTPRNRIILIRLWYSNDTIMFDLSIRQKKILHSFSHELPQSSSQTFDWLQQGKLAVSLVTVKRELDVLCSAGLLERQGRGRAIRYCITIKGLLLLPYNVTEYVSYYPDVRVIDASFRFDLFEQWPVDLLDQLYRQNIATMTTQYQQATAAMSPVIEKKELERFIIELSWKSSAIEGNTYTLLDTENLLKDGIVPKGYSAEETQMILNHKIALEFVRSTSSTNLTLSFIEKVHELLVQDLGIERGLRKTLVGITGTAYRPLDNQHQIIDQIDLLIKKINCITNPFEKAFLALLGLSYIQPFADGNKRTARLVANSILLHYGYAPLSYRSVDVEHYRGAMLVFYEQQSAKPAFDIFYEQYQFSVEHYRVTKKK